MTKILKYFIYPPKRPLIVFENFLIVSISLPDFFVTEVWWTVLLNLLFSVTLWADNSNTHYLYSDFAPVQLQKGVSSWNLRNICSQLQGKVTPQSWRNWYVHWNQNFPEKWEYTHMYFSQCLSYQVFLFLCIPASLVNDHPFAQTFDCGWKSTGG